MTLRRKASFSVDAAKTMLRDASLRCTAARIAVVQTLGDSSTPLSPNEVSDILSEFGFDKSTIYRSLTELEEADIVAKLQLGDAIKRYELLPEGANGQVHHPHFMCDACGKVICLTEFKVDILPNRRSLKLPGKLTEVLLKGVCNDCE